MHSTLTTSEAQDEDTHTRSGSVEKYDLAQIGMRLHRRACTFAAAAACAFALPSAGAIGVAAISLLLKNKARSTPMLPPSDASEYAHECELTEDGLIQWGMYTQLRKVTNQFPVKA